MNQNCCDNANNANSANKINKTNTTFSLFDWVFIIMDFIFINDVNGGGKNMIEQLSIER
jgi:hypothetical protein